MTLKKPIVVLANGDFPEHQTPLQILKKALANASGKSPSRSKDKKKKRACLRLTPAVNESCTVCPLPRRRHVLKSLNPGAGVLGVADEHTAKY